MINKDSISDQLFNYIKERISSGAWPLGSKIPSENALTAELKVSRSALREVLQQFAALGILQSFQGKGTFVKSDNIDKLTGSIRGVEYTDIIAIGDILNYRLIVEPESVRMAMSGSEDKRLALAAELKELHQKMQQSVGDSDPFIQADIAFHTAIAVASGNVIMADTLKELFARTLPLQQKINTLFGFKDGLHYHEKIIKAVEAGDSSRAVKEMRRHMQSAVDSLKLDTQEA